MENTEKKENVEKKILKKEELKINTAKKENIRKEIITNSNIKKEDIRRANINKQNDERKKAVSDTTKKINIQKKDSVSQETKVFQPIKNTPVNKEDLPNKPKIASQINEQNKAIKLEKTEKQLNVKVKPKIENTKNELNVGLKQKTDKIEKIINIESTPSESIEAQERKKIASQKMIEKENDVVKTEKSATEETNKKEKKKSTKIILIIIMIILFIGLLYTAFTIFNLKNNKIMYGIYINNVNVSNLTKQEAIEKLEKELINEEDNKVAVHKNNFYKEIKLEDIEGKYDIVSAVDLAYNIGRESNIIQNNNKIFLTIIKKEKINMEFTYNEELYEKIIKEISLEIPDLALDSSYTIDGNNLIIKNSTAGVKINKNQFIQQISEGFITDKKDFEIPVEYCEKEEIDLEKIREEIYKEPLDAYYTKNPYEIFKEENGLDFAISIKDAEKLLLEDKTEYIIPLKELEPDVKVEDLNSEAFPDLISTFTTKYGTGDANRNTNIALAAKSINNVVLMPGETFSYNDLIGECSTRTGYKAATIYLNGELSTGIGGGICQVSTTMYNTALRANLEIVERRNHSLGVTYVPYGHDAMVSMGTQDFKFKNNRNYPVKVVAYVGTGSITCQIYGLKQDVEYEVKLQSRTLSDTETKCKVETYKILYLDGKEVSRTWLSTDTYKKH